MSSNFATQHCPAIDLPDTGEKFPNVLSTPRFTSPDQVPKVPAKPETVSVLSKGFIATIEEVCPPIDVPEK